MRLGQHFWSFIRSASRRNSTIVVLFVLRFFLIDAPILESRTQRYYGRLRTSLK